MRSHSHHRFHQHNLLCVEHWWQSERLQVQGRWSLNSNMLPPVGHNRNSSICVCVRERAHWSVWCVFVCVCMWPPKQPSSNHSNRPMSGYFFYICHVPVCCTVVKNETVSFWNLLTCCGELAFYAKNALVKMELRLGQRSTAKCPESYCTHAIKVFQCTTKLQLFIFQ